MDSLDLLSTATAYEPGETPVLTRELRKSYQQIEAVSGLNLRIKQGEIFGLIGPDGAGKTTTFHMLGGVLEPSGGEVLVLGRKPRDAKLDIGYLTQQFSLPLDLSIDENMRYMAGIRQVPEAQFKERSKRYITRLGLQGFGNRLAGQLSGGMKQKLALCCALITRPKLLLLDEPTTGVDPVSRREFWDVLAAIAAEGVTIAVATPYLDEAERCNRVALMHNGVIQQLGTPLELRNRLNLRRLKVTAHDMERLETEITGAGAKLAVADVQPFGDRLDVLVPDADSGERQVRELALKVGISELALERDEPTLENVFVASLKSDATSKAGYTPFPFLERAHREGPGSVAISANNLYKKFGHFEAVKHVDLQIQYGEIYGLLGANGAGKTTTIKMLCGLLEPAEGVMMLAGQTRDLRSQQLRRRIGYMSQKFTLYDDLTIRENLEFYCGVYQVPMRLREERIRWVLKSCDLLGRESLLTGQLPGGWKQRLSFGASVMHEPEILFLDEPTSGVDPIARRQLWNMIRDFARHGTAILVTTHFLEEAENCHRLGFMVAGRLVAQGTPGEIKSTQPGRLVVLDTNNPQKTSDLLKTKLESWRVSIFAHTIHVVLDDPDNELPDLLAALESNGIAVQSQKYGAFSLEDAFIGVVQRSGGAEP